MGELGQLLRETREEKGITLEEVEGATRIRLKFLAALEEGDYEALPTPGHVHGFLRNYARHLGLDLNEVQDLYVQETSSHRLLEPGIFHPKDITLMPRRPLVKADLILGLVIAAVVLVTGGWAFWQYGWPRVQPMLLALTPAAAPSPTAEQSAHNPTATATRTPRPPTPTPMSPTATPTEMALSPTPTATRDQPVTVPTATPSPTVTPTRSPTDTPTPMPTRTEGVVLQVQVIERAWLQVTVDGQELPGELLEAGDEREWVAQHTIHFISGNAGGVEVTVNGEELGTLGERAQVVEKLWTPRGEATPTPGAAGTPTTPTATPASASSP